MSDKVKLPRCPYCHKKISYPGAMFLKTKGEFSCGSCKCISNVVISRGAFALASMVCIVALLIVVLYSISGDHGSFLGLACVFAPFLIFYIMIPFFVKLAPCKDKSAVKKLLDKRGEVPAGEAVFASSPLSQTEANPVQLDVDEDFSAKFMKAKNTVHQNAESNGNAVSYERPQGEIEDIQNTKIAFEINTNSLEDDIINEEKADYEEDIKIFRRDGEENYTEEEAYPDEQYAAEELSAESLLNEEKTDNGEQQ